MKFFRQIAAHFPFATLLLPVFFVLHGWKENYYYIHFRDVLILLFTFLVSAILLFLICLLFFRNKMKAGMYTFILLSVYFFFGAAQDFLKEHSLTAEISRYKFLLPVVLLLMIIAFAWLKKTKRALQNSNAFLSLLMVILILVDLATIIALPLEKKEKISIADLSSQTKICKDCPRPDIYFLLFDEYASSAALKRFWNYDNSNFDSSLSQRGFHLITNSQSNYNFTPFSMASILNMSYLEGIKNTAACTIEDYSMCSNLILTNTVTAYLRNNGYEFTNYSIFDIAGAPSTVYQSFLPLKARLITEQTLFNRIKKDFGYLLLTGPLKIKWLARNFFYSGLRNNNLFLKKVKEEAGIKKDQPRFTYAHFYMPHPPFYFDSAGKERDEKIVVAEAATIPPASYLQYIGYTNVQILQLVDTILKKSATPPVIVIMGDHGFRNCAGKDQNCFFKNMNAVYLPGKNYNGFYDSQTGVNEFRTVFNAVFKENFPLLKDSTIFLKDRQ